MQIHLSLDFLIRSVLFSCFFFDCILRPQEQDDDAKFKTGHECKRIISLWVQIEVRCEMKSWRFCFFACICVRRGVNVQVVVIVVSTVVFVLSLNSTTPHFVDYKQNIVEQSCSLARYQHNVDIVVCVFPCVIVVRARELSKRLRDCLRIVRSMHTSRRHRSGMRQAAKVPCSVETCGKYGTQHTESNWNCGFSAQWRAHTRRCVFLAHTTFHHSLVARRRPNKMPRSHSNLWMRLNTISCSRMRKIALWKWLDILTIMQLQMNTGKWKTKTSETKKKN